MKLRDDVISCHETEQALNILLAFMVVLINKQYVCGRRIS